METIKVAIVGATGVTGGSIVDGLLASDSARYVSTHSCAGSKPQLTDIFTQEITALIRPASVEKPAVADLAKKGVAIVSVDLYGPQEELVKMLQGIDVVISAIVVYDLQAEIPLADAAKAAGVKRFIPCFFASVMPPKGVLEFRDKKEDVLNHIKKIRLGYTVIDVGFWYQVLLPRLASGRIDYALSWTKLAVVGEGNVPSGMTDLRDIGKIVAKVIADPRTLNRMVFGYNKIWTQTEMHDLLEKLSGEKTVREYVSHCSRRIS